MSAKKEELKDAKHIVELDVKEVSLVDRAAIKRKFLIVKRTEEDMAAIKKGEEAPKAPVATDPQGVQTEAVKVVAKTEAPKVEEPKTEAPKVEEPKTEAATVQKVEGPKVEAAPVQTEAPKVEEPKTEAPKVEATSPEAAAVQKEAPKPDAYSVVVNSEGDVKVNGTLVELRKAKVFTGNRTQAIRDVILSLSDLLGEVDNAVLKEVHDKLATLFKPAPDLSSGIQPSAPAPVAVTKDTEDNAKELKEQIATVQKNLDGLLGRLEAVEKARTPSQSIEAVGGTEDKDKVQKSFWAGVI